MRSKRKELPSSAAYARAISSGCLTPSRLRAMQVLYGFPEHTATAGEVARKMGYKGFGGACLAIGYAGKALASALRIDPPYGNDPEKNWWSIIADADESGRYFRWIMRSQLAEALESLGLADL